MTDLPDDTDPSAKPAHESQTDPGPPSEASITPGEDAYLEQVLGGLRGATHFRPEPKQAATTDGESFAAHAAAPRVLPRGAATDPSMALVLLDITSPDGLVPEPEPPSADDLAVTSPLSRRSPSAGAGQRDAETGPALLRFAEQQRRRIVRASAVVAVLAAGALTVLVVTWRAGPRAPASTVPVPTSAPTPVAATPAPAVAAATAPSSSSVAGPVATVTAPSSLHDQITSDGGMANRSPAPPSSVVAAPSGRHMPPAEPKEQDDEIDRTRH